MSSAPTRTYAGESGPERVERRRKQLLEAALTVGDTIGWGQLSAERICREARLSKRYFYESFADLEAITAAVLDEVAASLLIELARATSAAEGLPSSGYTHTVLTALVDNLTDDPRRARALFGPLAATPALEQHRAELIRKLSTIGAQYAMRFHQLSAAPLADLGAALLIGGTGEVLIQWLDGRIKMSREELVAALAALWVFVGDGSAERVREAKAGRRSSDRSA